jgi:hypothetical protein
VYSVRRAGTGRILWSVDWWNGVVGKEGPVQMD